jgi:hypothetical protein
VKRDGAVRNGIAKSALVMGFASVAALVAASPVNAQINIDVPGLHVHVGRHHHRYYPQPAPAPYYGGGYYNGGGYYGGGTFNGCPPRYTIQDGICKPYRGY